MTNLEIVSLPENTKVRIKIGTPGTASCYTMKICLLKFYDNKREGRTWVNRDTGELVVFYPWGLQSGPSGVCYEFPASVIELL